MEKSDNFRLEAAIAQWRAGLENCAALRDADIDELEAHLRDAICAQQAKGAGEEASFHTAIRQMGSGQELSREYVKTSWPHVWMDRVLWLAVGLILAFAIWTFAEMAGVAALAVAASWAPGFGIAPVACFGGGVKVLVQVGIWLMLWHLVIHHGSTIGRCSRYCVRHPLLPLLGLLALNLNQRALLSWFANLPMNAKPIRQFAGAGEDTIAALQVWQVCFGLGKDILYLLCFSYLAWCFLRMPSLGLSRKVENAGGLGQVDIAGNTLVWRERALWMLGAPVIYLFVIMPLAGFSQVLAAMLASGLPRNGVVSGTLQLGLQWMGFLVLAGGLYWLGKRGAAGCARIKHVLANKPAASAVGIVFSLIGLPFLVMIGFKFVAGSVLHSNLPNLYNTFLNSDFDPETQIFFLRMREYSWAAWVEVVPVCLMFWIARKRAGLPFNKLFAYKKSFS